MERQSEKGGWGEGLAGLALELVPDSVVWHVLLFSLPVLLAVGLVWAISRMVDRFFT